LLSPDEALQYAIDIGVALSRAHELGIVHGKISPQTVLIGEAGAVLLKPLFSEKIEPAYRAPEQVQGKPADERSDIFSFGALLHELAFGDALFQGEGSELSAAILEKDLPALESNDPIHQAMEKVFVGCLEKDPSYRRQPIQAAVAELKLTATACAKPVSELDPEDPQSPEQARAPRLKQWSRMRAWVVVAAALLLCAGSVAAVMLLPVRNSAPVYRFSVDQEGAKYPGMPAISPDGRSLIWSATRA
jgi:serine/threonine-protein kinase